MSLVQGSTVVFGSYPYWTSTDPTSPDFCKETPMMFAFSLLVTTWVKDTVM